MGHYRQRASKCFGLLVLSLALVTACSSGKKAATDDTVSPSAKASVVASHAAAARGAASMSSAPKTSTTGLSGTWTGSYDGIAQGTFTLKWQQSGSNLTGTIDLSTSGTVPISGHVVGDRITFGTVGSQAVTYTGTASGGSMSGTWQVKSSNGGSGGGTWKATKSG